MGLPVHSCEAKLPGEKKERLAQKRAVVDIQEVAMYSRMKNGACGADETRDRLPSSDLVEFLRLQQVPIFLLLCPVKTDGLYQRQSHVGSFTHFSRGEEGRREPR